MGIDIRGHLMTCDPDGRAVPISRPEGMTDALYRARNEFLDEMGKDVAAYERWLEEEKSG